MNRADMEQRMMTTWRNRFPFIWYILKVGEGLEDNRNDGDHDGYLKAGDDRIEVVWFTEEADKVAEALGSIGLVERGFQDIGRRKIKKMHRESRR